VVGVIICCMDMKFVDRCCFDDQKKRESKYLDVMKNIISNEIKNSPKSETPHSKDIKDLAMNIGVDPNTGDFKKSQISAPFPQSSAINFCHLLPQLDPNSCEAAYSKKNMETVSTIMSSRGAIDPSPLTDVRVEASSTAVPQIQLASKFSTLRTSKNQGGEEMSLLLSDPSNIAPRSPAFS
jgi:hypothetical protein